MTDQLARTDPLFLRLNLIVLLVVVFLPFPTHLVADGLGDRGDERVYVTLYGLTQLAIRLLGAGLDAYARRREDAELHRDRRTLLRLVVAYVVAVGIGIAVPVVAVALYFGITVYLFVPFRGAARILSRRRGTRG